MQMCQSKDCPHEGQWVPKLCVPHAGRRDDPASMTMILGLRLCRRHVEEFQASQIIDQPTPAGSSTFRQAFSEVPGLTGGRVDFDRAYVAPLRTNTDEFKTYERIQSAPR